MALEISAAETPEDLMAAFRLRSAVFRGEGILHADAATCGGATATAEPLVDAHDAFGCSRTFIARIDNGEIVGSLRATAFSHNGFPADQYFDFAPFLPDGGQKAISFSMLCVDPAHRGIRLAIGLLRMGFYWGIANDGEHFFAPVRPEAVPLIERLGGRRVADSFDHPVEGVPVVPMLLNVSDNDPFLATARQLGAHDLIEDFRRRSFRRGETVLRVGDEGSEAFVIVDGQAHVLVDDREVAGLAPGDLFGETALLLDGRRSATVVADSDLDVMVLSRDAFERQILRHPERARALMRTLGERVQERQQRASADAPK